MLPYDCMRRPVQSGSMTQRSRNSNRWELYNLKTDRCEMNDLSAKHPEKVKALGDRWQQILDGFIEELKKDPTPIPPRRKRPKKTAKKSNTTKGE